MARYTANSLLFFHGRLCMIMTLQWKTVCTPYSLLGIVTNILRYLHLVRPVLCLALPDCILP